MIAYVLAAALAAGSSAPTSPAKPAVVVNSDWRETPDADDLASYYPAIAGILGLAGQARIKCEVNEVGRLEVCEVVYEAPRGMGFGAAVVRAARHFQMDPKLEDGRPVRGEVVVPLRFSPPEVDSVLPAQGDAPTQEAMELGRRLAKLNGFDDVFLQGVALLLSEDGERRFPEADPRLENDLLQLAADMLQESKSKLLDGAARDYAAAYSVEELTGIVGFFESPPGRAYVEKQQVLQEAFFLTHERTNAEFTAELRRRFCADHPCEIEAAKSEP